MVSQSQRRFVVFPGLTRAEVEGGIILSNPIHHTEVEGDETLVTLLELFSAPKSVDELDPALGLDEDDLAPLIHAHVLVDEQELPFLEGGFLRPAQGSIGTACRWDELFASLKVGDRVLFGAPVDGAAGDSGARHGPREIRHAAPTWMREAGGLAREVLHIDLQRHYDLGERALFDVGNVVHSLHEPYELFGRRVSKIVDEVSRAGAVPLMMGGDHSVSWFALKPLLDRGRPLGIVHFDAHHDLYETRDGRLAHLNPFRFVCEHESLALLLQLGLRTVEPRPEGEPVFDDRIRCVTARELKRRTPEEVLAELPRDLDWYLSFDVDCLDPAVAPETGTQVLGGLGYYEALDLVDLASRELRLVGADFVEVTGSHSRRNMAAHMAGEYLSLCVLGGCAFAPLRTYYYKT